MKFSGCGDYVPATPQSFGNMSDLTYKFIETFTKWVSILTIILMMVGGMVSIIQR